MLGFLCRIVVYVYLIFSAALIYCYDIEIWDSSLNKIVLENGEEFWSNPYQFQHFGSHLSKNDIMKHLLKRPDFNFNLALHYLAMYGRPDVLAYVIDDLGANVHMEIDSETPINRCSTRIENLKILLNRGANVNHLNRYGQHIGFDVVRSGEHDMLLLLIENGLDMNIYDKKNKTMISCIMDISRYTRFNQTKIIKLLNEHMENPEWNKRYAKIEFDGEIKNLTILEEVALHQQQPERFGKELVLKELFEAGANFNTINEKNGYTPLHYAESLGFQKESVQYFLKYGADPTIRNFKGQTAKELGEEIEREHRRFLKIRN